jgi:hypothetical protein
MPWTYTTLKQMIQDTCEYEETTFVAHLDDFIRAGEERIMQSVELDIFRKNVSGNMAAGDRFLQVPADYLSPGSMSIETGVNATQFVLNKDVEFVQDYGASGAQSQPKYYALYNSTTFILAPTPDQDYLTELHYFYEPESIVTAGTTWLGTNAEQALLYACLIEAYIYMKGEADVIAMYSQRYSEALLRLKNYAEGRENVDSFREGLVRTKAT